jgi:hypothetical protein
LRDELDREAMVTMHEREAKKFTKGKSRIIFYDPLFDVPGNKTFELA